ncbi:MAG: SpaA isopeptide-forming pilin-related protein, partial [Bacillus sp. (in: firmicutes)]
ETFTINAPNQKEAYTYENGPVGSLEITKVDSEDKEVALEGAEFTLTYPDGTTVTKATDSSGKVKFEELAYGEYSVEETKAPEGYVLSKRVETFTINAPNQKEAYTYENTPVGSVEITKVDSESGAKLEGAEFKLTDQEGKDIETLTTDENGKVTFKDLPYGEYQLEETKAPEGYLLPEGSVWNVTIKDQSVVPLEIVNTLEQPSLSVTKTADKTQYLPGETVTYTINVTNDGNVDLEGITLEDVFSKNDVAADQQLTIEGYEDAFNLAVGETASFTSKFVIPENDLADTTYKNVVKATTGDTTGEDEETIVVDPTYAFTIEKTADKTEATVGDKVTYSIVVTNTGNKALTNVHVTDEMIGLDTIIDQLEVNESKTLTGEYVVTADDIGDLENIATATVDVDGNTITHEASAVVKVSAKVAPAVDETPTTIDKIVTWVQNPKTGDATINTLLILFVFVLAGSGLYVYRRKHRG